MKKYGKLRISLVLALLVLLTLSLTAWAEGTDGRVTAAATENSIEFVSIDEVKWDHITYTVRVTATEELAANGYRIGAFYSPDQDFSSRAFQFKDTFGTDEIIYPYQDHLFHDTSGVYQFTRYVVQLIPDKQYYIRPMLFSSNQQSFDPLAVGVTWSFPSPAGNSDYTNMILNQPVVPPHPGYVIHAKFTAAESGQYALVGDGDMEFISYCFPDAYSGDSKYSVYVDHGDGTTSHNELKLFIDLSAGDTVYLFGKRAEPEYITGDGELRIVPAADAAQGENSIEVGDAFDVTNMGAKFPFTVSTTADTAKNGYQVGIIYGDHGTEPSTWKDTIRIYMPEKTIQSSAEKTYGNSSMLVPGMNIDYQAALFDLNSDRIHARGSYIGHLEAPGTLSNMTALTAGSTFTWSDPGMKPFYFEVTQSGVYTVHGENMNSIKVMDQTGKTRSNMGGQSEYNISVYAKAGETLYAYSVNGSGNTCGITVNYDNSRIADTQQLQAAVNAGETNLNLDNYGTFEITDDVTVPSNAALSFYGTELVIDPGVTLTVLGHAEGGAVNAAGTLMVSGDGAFFRTDAHFAETGAGELIVDGHAHVELASDSFSNNTALDPNLNMTFLNGGGVTFGYYVPDEETLHSLNATVDDTRPEIRHDMQIYSDLTLSGDLTLREHVALHTDRNWSNGGGFTIPAGVTLSIPQSGGFYAHTSAINIGGSLVNNGEIALSSVGNVENYPTIINMTLQDGGSYSGSGQIAIDTLENPFSYLDGFDGYRVNELWRDEMGSRVICQLVRVYDFTNNLQGSYTLPDDLTIAAGEQLLADTLTIPSGVTLTVNGGITVNNALVIQQGGALDLGEGARLELHNFQAPPTACSFEGAITMRNNAALYTGLGQWTGTNLKNVITVDGQNALIQIDYSHTSGSPKTVDEMLAVLTGEDSAVPSALRPYVIKQFSLCIPYEAAGGLTIPDEIDFRVLNNGSDQTGRLTIPQGAVLTIPQGAYLGLNAADLTVNGTVENSGRIELMTYRSGPDGAMPTFTLGSGAVYQGKGQIWVRSYQNEPEQYLVGFDPNLLTRYNRDDMGGQFVYFDRQAIFADFKSACESQNPPAYYDELQNLGTVTISENLTIPAGMEVNAWGTTLVIPEHVTLLVNGGLGCEGFDIAEGGTLQTEGSGDSDWAHVDTNEIACAGSIVVGAHSNFGLDYKAWNETVAAHMTCEENDDRNVNINIHANNEAEYQQGLQAAQSFNPYGIMVHMNMNINYACVLQDGAYISGLFDYHVHRDEYSNGSLTVPEDATVTVGADSYVGLHGSSLIVSGVIVNNGRIELNEAGYEGGETGSLVIADGGSYRGGGQIQICDCENPKSRIRGIPEGRIMQIWKDEWSGWSGYRILSAEPNPISDGSSFRITTAEEGIFYSEYSAGYVMSPTADGLYSFTLSFDAGTALRWNDARLGINGTDLQDQSFDTNEPESLTFLARMTANEAYELVFSNNADLGPLTVNVTVGRAAGGFAEMLNAMGANPYQRFAVPVTNADLEGLTMLTVPINVALNVNGTVTIPSGLTVACYGDFQVNRGGSLLIPSGAHVSLIPDADWRTYGCVIMNGGTLEAAANSMSFDGRACVQLNNRSYASNAEAVYSVTGVDIANISLEVDISSLADYEYWYTLKSTGYKDANLILVNGFSLSLTQDLPEGYCLVVNSDTSVTVPENTAVILSGYLAMEGGSFTNNGTLTVDEGAGINIWNPSSTVINHGTLLLYGTLRGDGEPMFINRGDLVVMNRNAVPTDIRILYNLYHYPEEHRLLLPATVTTVEEEAFANISAWEIDLPESIESIGDRAFADSEDLYLVIIPNGETLTTGNPFQNSPHAVIAAPGGDTVQAFADAAEIPFIPLGS